MIHPGKANLSKDEVREKLAALYKAPKENVVVFGFAGKFGGGRSTGFGLIYDTMEDLKKFEPKYRLGRVRFIDFGCKPIINTLLITDRSLHARGDVPQAAQGAQEPHQEGPRYREGQGYHRQGQEGALDLNSFLLECSLFLSLQ